MNKLKFSGSWRDYQKRILDDLNFHLADNKIHVVAAPGAGKTTLGIEVISRINKPTLILAPTITIRNQWKQRIIDAFLTGDPEEAVSIDIKAPKFVTVITYQALLAAFCGSKNDECEQEDETDNENQVIEEVDEEKITSSKRFRMDKAEDIIKLLSDSGIKLLCFDEAHHLRKEWWKALDYLVENLQPEQSIALTATPPYDAEGKEWERYEALCGPIDEVISIPELVANGDLCPHQDFIHFSSMRKNENEKVKEYLKNINDFLCNLINNDRLKRLIIKKLNEASEEEILDEPKLYISLCSFLKIAKERIPENLLELFGITEKEVPVFKSEFQKSFLIYLFNNKDTFKKQEDVKLIAELAKQARAAGILNGKTIYLNDSPKLKRQIANSIGKLDSIKRIVDLEIEALKNDLRMVILADYIKADNMDASELGVIPIWQTLKDRKDISLAVLTGSLILIPAALKEELDNYVTDLDLTGSISTTTFERDTNFIKVNSKGSKKSCAVELITKMFVNGHITIMVGTQALLGEGWDAPCINSLILSSTVSSYMLSNQMRGRAIRIDKNNPNKISNIWHLASIKIATPEEIMLKYLQMKPGTVDEEAQPEIELFDYEQLCNRFRGFQAPSFREPVQIESSIDRILPIDFNKRVSLRQVKEQDFINLNQIMEANARNRNHTKELWNKGTIQEYNAPPRTLKEGVSAEIDIKHFKYAGYWTIFYTVFSLWCSILYGFLYSMSRSRHPDLWFMLIIIIICVGGFAISMFKPTLKYFRCSSPEKIMKQIGIVFLETLAALGKIKENLNLISLDCDTDSETKEVFFSASNLSPEENNLLINCILEFLNPIENPRYLFIRKDKVGKIIETTDYHAMPAVVTQTAASRKTFKMLWEKYIGKCDIIYTRNASGRRALLKARKNSFSDLQRTPKARQLSRFE